MKAMFAAFLAIAVIAVGADYGLDRAGFASDEVLSSPNVRLD
jgi:hypothetical protein